MTEIDFHVAPPTGRRPHDAYVCGLIERVWAAGRRVHVHCADAASAQSVDELLWVYRDASFVPHAIAGTPEAQAAPVVLDHGTQPPATAEVLVNLAPEVPAFFSQFERVIETAGFDEEARQHARRRYRFYKDRGYPITNHHAA